MTDRGRLEELLATVSVREIAEAWCCYHERRIRYEHVADHDPDWWAVQFWLSNGLAFRQEGVARDGLLALIEAAPENLLAYVGAGPLMNFVEPDEGRISWIEGVAATSSRFRTALTAVAVWQEEDWVVERLERAAGGRLYRPSPTDT